MGFVAGLGVALGAVALEPPAAPPTAPATKASPAAPTGPPSTKSPGGNAAIPKTTDAPAANKSAAPATIPQAAPATPARPPSADPPRSEVVIDSTIPQFIEAEPVPDEEIFEVPLDSIGLPIESMFGPRGPTWRTYFEGMLLTKTKSNNRQLAVLVNRPNGNVRNLGVQDLGWDYEGAGKVRLARTIKDSSTYLEISYLGAPFFSSNRYTLTNDQTLIVSGVTALGNAPRLSQLAEYDAQLHDSEFNFRTDIMTWPFISVFGGLRYIHYREAFQVTELSYLSTTTGLSVIQSILLQQSYNNIFGPQIGMDCMAPLNDFFNFGMTAKAGYGLNVASFSNDVYINSQGPVASINPGALSQAGNRIKKATGMFEATLGGTLRLTPRATMTAGYRAIYLAGITLASENIITPSLGNGSTGQQSNFNGDLFFHGPYAGVEIGWGDFPQRRGPRFKY